MADLDINKEGFDGCISRLENLTGMIGKIKAEIDAGGDTSLTMAKEKECAQALSQMLADLASLAEDTAKDVKLTKARYELADN